VDQFSSHVTLHVYTQQNSLYETCEIQTNMNFCCECLFQRKLAAGRKARASEMALVQRHVKIEGWAATYRSSAYAHWFDCEFCFKGARDGNPFGKRKTISHSLRRGPIDVRGVLQETGWTGSRFCWFTCWFDQWAMAHQQHQREVDKADSSLRRNFPSTT